VITAIHRFRTIVYSLAIALVAFAASSHGSASTRPNILMIAVDDLRPMLGCYGDTRIQTPHIDRLAENGVLFKRAYCQYAKCGTSRLSLLTGLRPDRIGVFGNNVRYVDQFRERNPDIRSLPRWFKDNGYHTLGFGKLYHDGWDQDSDWSAPPQPGREREMWEIVPEDDPSGPTIIANRLECPVIQSPDVEDEHLFAGRMTRDAISTVEGLPSEKPWFIAIGYRRPHLPFVAPKKYFDLYEPDQSWLPPNPLPGTDSPILAWFTSDGYRGTARNRGFQMPLPPTRQEAIDWNGYELRSYEGVPDVGSFSIEKQFDLLQAYAACISYVDEQIGKLLDALEDQDSNRETVIVFWSDHGWHLGEHSARGKMSNYEIATRVPFIISDPRIEPGKTDTIVELVDLYPTLCDLADIPEPEYLQGSSLRGALEKLDTDQSSFALSQYARYDDRYMGRAIRTDRFRYVDWIETETGKRIAEELYDHDSDSHERYNLASNPRYEKELSRLRESHQKEFGLSQ